MSNMLTQVLDLMPKRTIKVLTEYVPMMEQLRRHVRAKHAQWLEDEKNGFAERNGAISSTRTDNDSRGSVVDEKG